MTVKKTIWVVRHAQSNHQIGLQKETCDCDLSPEGFRQASTLAGRLAGIGKLVIEEDDVRRIWLWDAWADWEDERTM